MKYPMATSKKKITLKTGLIVLAGTGGLLIVFVCLIGYVAPAGNRAGDVVRGTIALPLVVDGYHGMITTKELTENIRSVRRFYENQDFSRYGFRIDFSTEEGKKRLLVREKEVLNKMYEDAIVMKLAHEQGIVVTKEAAHDGVRRKLEEHGGTAENVEASLDRLYGWTMGDFEEKVVTPDLYQERLIEAYNKDAANKARAEKQIREARRALDSGVSFEEAVARYSEGRTKSEGGELGWFLQKDLSRSIQSSVEKQEVGTVGDVVESEIGFHIIIVEETKQEGDRTLYRLKQIFTKKKTAADWLVERIRASPPLVLSREYVWDVESARIEFRDDAMRRFEQRLIEESQQDTSLIP